MSTVKIVDKFFADYLGCHHDVLVICESRLEASEELVHDPGRHAVADRLVMVVAVIVVIPTAE